LRFRLIPAIIAVPVLLVAARPGIAAEPYWQCAAFARQYSGIAIRGDAWTWWGQAEGRYVRGQRPRVGAVMSFSPSGNLRLGHVATVTRMIGAREVAVTHANWSPIGGVRGQIERDVRVRDVSDHGDWSRVRVWYAPIGDLGTGSYPLDGFIYPEEASPAATRFADAGPTTPQRVAWRPAAQLAPQRAPQSAPRLAYARIDGLVAGQAMAGVVPQRLRLSRDLVRLAQLEDRQGR